MERCKFLTSSDSFSKEVALSPPHGGKKRHIMCVILQVYLVIRNYRNHRDRFLIPSDEEYLVVTRKIKGTKYDLTQEDVYQKRGP